ncbi:MAG: ABC-type dipeptide transport system, periplasmic component, partial [Acidimicrobiales bacterium]|nr:ABC-type dipeptide transport system, periplasmic component [Acidimicrobiales bacterium]
MAGLLAISLLAAGCGGAKEGSEGAQEKRMADTGLDAESGESGLDAAAEPKRGGKLVYALEADTNGGFCLTEAQLAISGMMVVRAVYDTLTVPNEKGEYVPYLAKALTHNDDHTEWNIELREGIKFHDGSDLTAEVVKNNLDAYRGAYPNRSSLLFSFVLKNVESVEVVDPLNVKVTTSKPWVAYPAYLFGSSRLGIMAQAQLDSKDCATKPIGTGPFAFKSWTPNVNLVAERNPDYWQIAPDGEPYPYA